LVIGVVGTLVIISLAISWGDTSPSTPLASITLSSYSTQIITNPNPRDFCYPPPGKWIKARMILKNEGHGSICYEAWAGEPYGWAIAKTADGKTNGYLAPRFTGGFIVMKPGETNTFWVYLPSNTLHWQCGFDVETPSAMDRAAWRVQASPTLSRLPDFMYLPLRLLSDERKMRAEVKSQVIDLTNPPTTSVTMPTTFRLGVLPCLRGVKVASVWRMRAANQTHNREGW
jgi:hypothetical protein